MSADPVALDLRAAALVALAHDVELALDPAVRVAGAPGWHCPHADRVREELRAQRAVARSTADVLRSLATEARRDAGRAREEQARERDAAQRRLAELGPL